MTELSREDVLRIADETKFIKGRHVEEHWLSSLERFAAAIYSAGAKSEREVSDRLLAAAKNLKLVKGRHHTEIAYLALEKLIAEVEAMRAQQAAMRKEKPE